MRIDDILQAQGISKAELARRMGTTRQNITTLLRNPSVNKCAEIAQALNIPLWQLFASPEDVAAHHDNNEMCAFVRIDGVHLHADTWEEFWAIVDEISSTHPRPRKQP